MSTFQVMAPVTITNSNLLSSNVPENDHAEWDVGTAYSEGDNVIVTGDTHKVYEALVANTGVDPESDGATWLELSATNRWKAFDGFIADQVSQAGSIEYEIAVEGTLNGVAFFGLSATSVTVVVKDASSVIQATETIDLVDGTEVNDWLSFFYEPLKYDTEAVSMDFIAVAGYTLEITIDAGAGVAEVGQIVVGRRVELGTIVGGSEPSYTPFSTKTRDDFGRVSIVDRGFADQSLFRFIAPSRSARLIKRTVAALDAVPSVWMAGPDMDGFGLTVYGFPSAPLQSPLNGGGTTEYAIEIEGLK